MGGSEDDDEGSFGGESVWRGWEEIGGVVGCGEARSVRGGGGDLGGGRGGGRGGGMRSDGRMVGGEAGCGTSGSGKGGCLDGLGGLSFGSGGSCGLSRIAPISSICFSSESG